LFNHCSGNIVLHISVSHSFNTCTAGYTKCESGFVTRNKKLTIPWGVLVKDPSSWIVAECIPEDFVWKDPSKIQIAEVFRLLSHWSDRQDQGLGPLMWVPTSPLFQKVEHPPRHKRQHLRHARAQQSNESDQESFDLNNYGGSNQESSNTDKSSAESSDSNPPDNRTSDGERETSAPSTKSSSSDESSDNAMATESHPFHQPAEQSDPGKQCCYYLFFICSWCVSRELWNSR
jgi:hypothetical protein